MQWRPKDCQEELWLCGSLVRLVLMSSINVHSMLPLLSLNLMVLLGICLLYMPVLTTRIGEIYGRR